VTDDDAKVRLRLRQAELQLIAEQSAQAELDRVRAKQNAELDDARVAVGHAETIVRRSVALWGLALTIGFVLCVVAAFLQSEMYVQLAACMIIPMCAGAILHMVYSDRRAEARRELKKLQ
jgi:tRNA(Arg) A34 adenosine deaminase TadA